MTTPKRTKPKNSGRQQKPYGLKKQYSIKLYDFQKKYLTDNNLTPQKVMNEAVKDAKEPK